MVVKVCNRSELKRFVYFVKDLYCGEKNYVLPFFSIQMKELTKFVLQEETYFALMYVEQGRVLGRILYTFQEDKNNTRKCFFSFFDFYNDIQVAKALVDAMQDHADRCGHSCLEGPYCPYDPDTRRGVLTNCFDKLPSVFLTYNFPYYVEIYEKLGFSKLTDTVSMSLSATDAVYQKADRIGKLLKNQEIEFAYLNRKNIKNDIQAIVDIMAEASTDINYERPPSYAMIEGIFKSMRMFLKDQYIVIARERKTQKAVGFVVCIPELNQIFSKFNGRFSLWKYLKCRKRINKVRGWLQYIIPRYQKKFLLGGLFSYVGESMRKDGIEQFEGGTIVEDNSASHKVFAHFGGKVDKIYRIYGRQGRM